MPRTKKPRQQKPRSNGHAADPPSLASLPEFLTPKEAGQVLRLGRNGIYDALKSGALPSVRIGRLIRIRKSVLVGGD